MLSEFLIKRSVESYNITKEKFKKLSSVFNSTPNGYIEIKLKLFSWIPLVSSFFPNDLIKIYKQGDNLRIDCIYYHYYIFIYSYFNWYQENWFYKRKYVCFIHW